MFDTIILILLTIVAAIATGLVYIRLPAQVHNKNFDSITVGHRGCRRFKDIPENSIPSFKFAIAHGAQGVELDCRLTKDGEVVVIHDDATKRLCTGENRWISDMTWKEVQQLSYLDHSNPNERIPLLADVLKLAKASNVKVYVELKSLYYSDSKLLSEKVCAIFAQLDAYDYACVIAFSPIVIYWVRRISPRIECCILYATDFYSSAVRTQLDRTNAIVNLLHTHLDFILRYACMYVVPFVTGCGMVGPDMNLVSKRDVRDFIARGLGVYVWVPNTPTDAQFFLDLTCSVGTDKVFPITPTVE